MDIFHADQAGTGGLRGREHSGLQVWSADLGVSSLFLVRTWQVLLMGVKDAADHSYFASGNCQMTKAIDSPPLTAESRCYLFQLFSPALDFWGCLWATTAMVFS